MRRNRRRPGIEALVLLLLASWASRLWAADAYSSTTIASLYHTREELKNPSGIELMDGVTMGVLLEVEAGYEKQGDDSVGDAALATFEVGIDADLGEGVSGHVLLLWEEDDTEPLDLDEGYITLGNTENLPLFLAVGKMYVPFGAFHSHFVSDATTLELGETGDSAVVIGYESEIVQVSACIFNGEFDANAEDQMDDFAAALTITPNESVEIGVSWISDIGESEGLSEGLAESTDASSESALPYDSVAGVSVYAHATVGSLTLDAEYVGATGEFNAGLVEEASARPAAWNAEVAFGVTEAAGIAVRCEGSHEFPDMPEIQYGVAGVYGLTDNMTLTLEYLHGKFAQDEDRDLVTAQLGLQF